jgi:hypothetical protein
MSDHTPGPWYVEMGVHVLDSARTRIADVCDRYDGVNNNLRSSAEANARLIAHAPDLLDFADFVARMTTDSEMDGDMSGDDAVSTLSGIIETAREVFNKAKGLT